MPGDLVPVGYDQLLGELKERIRHAQIRAVVSVNRELVLLYWQIGRDILQRQEHEGWGTKVIDRLARDLRAAFPEMKGFSPRNLKYMRAFAAAYPDESIMQRAVAQLPWAHNVILLDKVKDADLRTWYARAAIQNGWSRDVLAHQIDSGLYQRQGQAITNFDRTLPAPQSDLAQQLLKDPYNFDFLTLDDKAHERDLERGLLDHLRDFLLELGVGFAFLGSQYHLEVAGEDFYLDLLFYHVRLRCYVVVELKIGDFQPEYAGKMNFYLAAADDLLRHRDDQPSIGIIMCRTRNRTVVEYALRDIARHGRAAWRRHLSTYRRPARRAERQPPHDCRAGAHSATVARRRARWRMTHGCCPLMPVARLAPPAAWSTCCLAGSTAPRAPGHRLRG